MSVKSINDYIKTSKKDIDAELQEVVINSTKRAIKKRRMELEEDVDNAKVKLKKESIITDLDAHDAIAWVQSRENNITVVKVAEAKLEFFNKEFPANA